MNKIVAWSIVFFVFGLFVYLTSDTLAPFIISFIFAYLLEPLITSNCKRLNLPRNIVAIGIFTIFIVGFIVAMVALVPIIYNQIAIFIGKIPSYKVNFESGLSEFLVRIDSIDHTIYQKISEALQNFTNSAFSILASTANNIWSYTIATINFFAIIALVPIILYYFLIDWPKMVKTIEQILPKKGKSKIREIFSDINQLLSAYIRGQLNICFLLGFFYVLGLNLIDIDLALLLGVISGFLVIIPFVGGLISVTLMLIICYVSYGFSIKLIYVLALFIIGHIIEGYILTPKIIGDKIGLHPVWIIFSIFAAGSVFGFVGVVFAIPIAGIVKILLSHLIDYYKSSKLYNN